MPYSPSFGVPIVSVDDCPVIGHNQSGSFMRKKSKSFLLLRQVTYESFMNASEKCFPVLRRVRVSLDIIITSFPIIHYVIRCSFSPRLHILSNPPRTKLLLGIELLVSFESLSDEYFKDKYTYPQQRLIPKNWVKMKYRTFGADIIFIFFKTSSPWANVEQSKDSDRSVTGFGDLFWMSNIYEVHRMQEKNWNDLKTNINNIINEGNGCSSSLGKLIWYESSKSLNWNKIASVINKLRRRFYNAR